MRTRGQGVDEVGDRFTQIMLTPCQVSVLHSDIPLVFLTGPPGTGKTVVLIQKALEWLLAGKNVHVCSTWYKSLASSFSIVQQLKRMVGEEDGHCVHLHKFCLSRWEQGRLGGAVTTLITADTHSNSAHATNLHLIVDEAYFDRVEGALHPWLEVLLGEGYSEQQSCSC